MALVASVDYPSKRIYLSASSINSDLDTMEVYREVRAFRVSTAEHQKFKPIIEAGGNLEKLPGKYTPAYVILAPGCYIVPYDATQRLKVIRDTFATDGRAGRDCFDRDSIIHNVDIDVDFPEIEIREVTVGGSTITPQQVANAVRSELSLELSRMDVAVSSRSASGALVQANVKQINDVNIIGSGLDGVDEWRREGT